jgi:hypothetical protein
MTTRHATLTYLANMADNYAKGRTTQESSSAKLISIVTGKRIDFVQSALCRLVMQGKVVRVRGNFKISVNN